MYRFYLNDVLLPVTPDSLKIKIQNKNKTVTLINEGEYSLLKQPGLSEIEFTALLPNAKYPFALYRGIFRPASYYLDILEKLKIELKPFPFRVLRSDNYSAVSAFNSEFEQVSLEEYTIEEDAEKYGMDVGVKIKLKQFRGFVTKTITIQKKGDQPIAVESNNRPSVQAVAHSYTIQAGDTLWGIAKTQLGDGSRYQELYDTNRDVIEDAARKHGRSSSSGGHWIYAGTVIEIPV